MDTSLVQLFIALLDMSLLDGLALTHSRPHEAKQVYPACQAAKGDFTVGLVAAAIAFIPNDAARAERVGEIVDAPNDLGL